MKQNLSFIFSDFINLNYKERLISNNLLDIKINESTFLRIFEDNYSIVSLTTGTVINIPASWVNIFSEFNNYTDVRFCLVDTDLDRLILCLCELSSSISSRKVQNILEKIKVVKGLKTDLIINYLKDLDIDLKPIEVVGLNSTINL